MFDWSLCLGQNQISCTLDKNDEIFNDSKYCYTDNAIATHVSIFENWWLYGNGIQLFWMGTCEDAWMVQVQYAQMCNLTIVLPDSAYVTWGCRVCGQNAEIHIKHCGYG